MNKIIGLISAWGAEKWIELSIKQALAFCDEVIVNVGPYVKNMEPFEDNTLSICEKFGNDLRIVISDQATCHADAKCSTLNKMLRSSKLHKKDNWIWLFDVDEYYLDKEVKEIKDILFNGPYDYLKLNEMYFFINMQKYLKSERYRMWRIQDTAHHFRPTNQWSGPRTRIFHDPKYKYFHYSTLMDQSMKIELFRTEYLGLSAAQLEKMEWTKDIYMNYDLENEDKWIKENEKRYGKRQPYWKSDFKPDKNGHLFTYLGPHPKLIENAGLTKIKDFRI